MGYVWDPFSHSPLSTRGCFDCLHPQDGNLLTIIRHGALDCPEWELPGSQYPLVTILHWKLIETPFEGAGVTTACVC